jgi:arginyl-tRNA synthetase
MICIAPNLKEHTLLTLQKHFVLTVTTNELTLNETKPEFEGDYSIVCFGIAKKIGKKPDEIAEQIGKYLIEDYNNFYKSYNVIKGFLNIVVNDKLYINYANQYNNKLPIAEDKNKKVMVEFSSPNTNKPLHFGHLRNNFLGESTSRIFKENGYEVIKSNLLNDRGIHICKSMYAWQTMANGDTPESTKTKGDHFVGKYYVAFEKQMKQEAQVIFDNWISSKETIQNNTLATLINTYKNAEDDKQKEVGKKILELAKNETVSMQGARKLLLQWEHKEPETIKLWEQMNSWVLDGFAITYKNSGISFDKYYKESETYLLGKEIVEKGVQQGVLFKKEDNSIWIDLTQEGLDEKLLLRGDGTSVYITQDIGTALLKDKDYNGLYRSVYVIADEQNYHMQVLQLILKKLGYNCAESIQHLSYGLVELPSGRMKTREGTVVDADDTIDEMIAIAAKHTTELGKVDGFTEEELKKLYNTIGLGALKFFLLRVDAKKKMIFNPEESIDFHGFTGPFVQYSYARTCAILRKAAITDYKIISDDLLAAEKQLLKICEQYYDIIANAAAELNPSTICNYVYLIAKSMNAFLAEHKILAAETEAKKQDRLAICNIVKNTIKNCMYLLGIDVPERM